jgi:GT2 family glycosyltransferase
MEKVIAAVLAYNQPQLTQKMFDQLGPAMVLVNNGSIVSQPFLPQHRVITLPKNLMFAGGWNAAMRVFTSQDWVWMLNSDVEGVNIDMMYILMDLAMDLNYAVISPSFNSPHVHMRRNGYHVRQVAWIDWCCPLVNMEVWKKVGPFDSENFPGYGADLDWCKRAQEKGYTFAVADTFEVYHHGSVTALAEGLQGKQGNVTAMNNALRLKWGVSSWVEMF